MYCPKCGTENPDNALLCQSCNSPLTPAPPVADAAQGIKTSGLAVGALICGILAPFTCFVTFLPAIILGIIALVKISQSSGQLKGNGLAIAGMAIPVAIIPIAALLMAILMPALSQVRTIAQRVLCGTNMSSLGKSIMLYADSYDGRYPTPEKWCDLLIEYGEASEETFICQGAIEGPCNYAMNINIQQYGYNNPPDMVLLFETYPGWNQVGGPEILSTENHGGDGCNILFNNFHVEFVETERLHTLRWTTEPEEYNQIHYIPLE